MLPRVEDVLALVKHLQSKVYAFKSRPTDATVRRALDQARALVVLDPNGSSSASVGAIFFAFACRGKALGEMWPLLPMALAKLVAKGNGYVLNANEVEMRELRMQIAMREISDETVLAWFRQRLTSVN